MNGSVNNRISSNSDGKIGNATASWWISAGSPWGFEAAAVRAAGDAASAAALAAAATTEMAAAAMPLLLAQLTSLLYLHR